MPASGERRDELIELGRFQLRWCREHGVVGKPGWAVYDGGHRITYRCWPTREEAQRHLEAIARIYARYDSPMGVPAHDGTTPDD